MPAPGVAKPGGVQGDADSAVDVGHARPGQHPERPADHGRRPRGRTAIRLAAAEANAFEKGLGKSSIEALEPGNEPELYPVFSWYVASNGQGVKGRPPSYDFNSFLGDFTSFAKVLPGPLAGPTTGAPKWMAHTAQFLSAEPRVKVVTLHRYPVQTCYIRKSSPQYPTAAHLLAPYATTRMANSVAGFVRIAHARHLPLRIDEMNTDSCGKAPGVSDAFVSSLWAVDALFEMARVGVDGVNMHTYPGATYQMFTFTQQGGQWRTTVKPEYYGLMLFAQAAPAGSRLIATSAKNARGIVTWATHGADGHTRVVLINESLNRRTVALNGGGSTRRLGHAHAAAGAAPEQHERRHPGRPALRRHHRHPHGPLGRHHRRGPGRPLRVLAAGPQRGARHLLGPRRRPGRRLRCSAGGARRRRGARRRAGRGSGGRAPRGAACSGASCPRAAGGSRRPRAGRGSGGCTSTW